MADATKWMNNALVLIAVTCAVTTTGLVVRRELRSTPIPGEEPPKRLDEKLWSEIAGEGRRIGPANAKATIVVFSDFECPACRLFATKTWPGLRAQFPEDVAVVFRHWPLDYHRYARPAARAAECAARQNQFLPFHDAVFHQQDSLGIKSFDDFAREAGVADLAAFAACSRATDTLSVVDRDVDLVRRLGGVGTPTVIINGVQYGNPPDSAETDQLIREAVRGSSR